MAVTCDNTIQGYRKLTTKQSTISLPTVYLCFRRDLKVCAEKHELPAQRRAVLCWL